jgi:hypothetical protein
VAALLNLAGAQERLACVLLPTGGGEWQFELVSVD